MKQLLIDSSQIILEASIFEQGAGILNLEAAFEHMQIKPEGKVSVFPQRLDLTRNNPYTFPYSIQPLYPTQMPLIMNLTVYNSLTLHSKVERIIWSSNDPNKDAIKINFRASDVSPYCGYIALNIEVDEKTLPSNLSSPIIVNGNIKVIVSMKSDDHPAKEIETGIELSLEIISKPAKNKRILWDQFHNLKFPESSFILRDSLSSDYHPFDLNGDSPYTNFYLLFEHFRREGYYLEVLRGSFECFNADDYGILLIVDPEDKFSEREIQKLQKDILVYGMSLMLFADWYEPKLKDINYFDTKILKEIPIFGGSNIPALNSLLEDFGIALGSASLAGEIEYGKHRHSVIYRSGTYIAKFPMEGYLITFPLANEAELISSRKNLRSAKKSQQPEIPVLGLIKNISGHPESGKIIVYGDSNCIDSISLSNDCFDLVTDMLRFIQTGEMELFQYYRDVQLNANYDAKQATELYEASKFPLLESISNHRLSTFIADSWICPVSYFDGSIDLHNMTHYHHEDPITIWISHKKEGFDYLDPRVYLSTEYIQVILMTSSVVLILLILCLLKKRKKRLEYRHLSKTKGKVFMV